MNRGELLRAVQRMLSWYPDAKDTTALQDCYSQVNIAMAEFAGAIPFGLIPSTHTVEIHKEVDQTSAATGLSSTTDPWVLISELGTTDAAIPFSGIFDGQELEVGSGTDLQRFRVRTIWRHATLAYTYISLDRPCYKTYTKVAFRLRQTTVPFPDDIVHLFDGHRYGYGGAPVKVQPLREQNYWTPPDVYRQAGKIQMLARGEHFQVLAPTRAPTVRTLDDPNVWVGKEPPGTFTYYYTVGYGFRSVNDGTPNGFKQVLWESSPSPVSAEVTAPSNGSAAIEVSLPNIAWPMQFDPVSTGTELRIGKSGHYKLVYRARKNVTGAAATYRTQIEYPNVPQLIAIVGDRDTTWIDNGAVIPDPFRRMPHSGGYYRYHPDVPSNEDDRFDFRVLRTPAPLQTDNDAVPVVDRAHAAVIDLCAYRVSLGLGRCADQGQQAYMRWNAALPKLRAALQSSSDVVTPTPYNARLPDVGYGYADWRTPINRS